MLLLKPSKGAVITLEIAHINKYKKYVHVCYKSIFCNAEQFLKYKGVTGLRVKSPNQTNKIIPNWLHYFTITK